MKLKFLVVIAYLLFIPLFVVAQNEDDNTISNEKIRKEMVKLIEKRKSLLKSLAGKFGLLKKGTQFKKARFEEKFSKLTPEEQQQKIEKWLTHPLRQKEIMQRYQTYIQLIESKKLDDETVEKATIFINEMKHLTPKNSYLCQIYTEELHALTIEDRNYLLALEKRIYFHQKRKDLDASERKALNEFETLDDYLEDDYWNHRNYGKDDRYKRLRNARDSMKWH